MTEKGLTDRKGAQSKGVGCGFRREGELLPPFLVVGELPPDVLQKKGLKSKL